MHLFAHISGAGAARLVAAATLALSGPVQVRPVHALVSAAKTMAGSNDSSIGSLSAGTYNILFWGNREL